VEALVAGVALVRLVSLVTPGVGLQVRQLREGLGATWVSALVRFVPCVGPDVLLKMGQLSEFALADLAPVGLDSQVDPHMLGEVGAVGKRLAALTALVRLGFPHVHLCVKLEVGFGSEHLWTHFALVFPWPSIHVMMRESPFTSHAAHLGCIDGLRHHQHTGGGGRREGGEVWMVGRWRS